MGRPLKKNRSPYENVEQTVERLVQRSNIRRVIGMSAVVTPCIIDQIVGILPKITSGAIMIPLVSANGPDRVRHLADVYVDLKDQGRYAEAGYRETSFSLKGWMRASDTVSPYRPALCGVVITHDGNIHQLADSTNLA